MIRDYVFIADRENEQRYENIVAQNKKLEGLFADTNIEEHFFQAVMAKRISATELYKHVEFPTYLTPGEVGCALSHLSIYKEFLEGEQPYLFIFEDDCIIDETLFTKELLDDIDTLFTETTRGKVLLLQKVHVSSPTGKSMGDCKLCIGRTCYFTHGYVINRVAAANILKLQSPIHFEIDVFKFYIWLNLLDVYALDRSIVAAHSVEEYPTGIDDSGQRSTQGRAKDKVRSLKYDALYKQLSFKDKARAVKLHIQKNLMKLFNLGNHM